ncbi:MAG: DUF4430 domain-containing protein [Clostridia bacterium]|nr:DUF4430 domain-containing protein [Clostridia bacterium]
MKSYCNFNKIAGFPFPLQVIAFLLALIIAFAPACANRENGPASPASSESASPSPTSGEDTEALCCTFYIECTTILNNMEKFNKDKLEVLPENGIILEKCTIIFNEGDSVYDVLVRELMARKIHMDASYTPVYDSAYIKGINNLYEFDCGEGSGWTYSVNGKFPNYGCSKYNLNNGDVVEWHYTCDFGVDVGCIFDADATPTPVN